jgi:hypothetical protein
VGIAAGRQIGQNPERDRCLAAGLGNISAAHRVAVHRGVVPPWESRGSQDVLRQHVGVCGLDAHQSLRQGLRQIENCLAVDIDPTH